MRRDGIPYVSNGVYNPPYPAVPLQDMTLDEIKKKYLSICAKANGDPSICSKCTAPCPEGKRAIQLLANQVYNDPPIPLYGGKTLIEKAREENMLRRQRLEEEKKKDEKNVPKEKQYVDNWYEDSLASGDQLAWVMEKFNMTKTQAKKKIYSYRYRNGLSNKEYFTKGQGRAKPVIQDSEVVKEEIKQTVEEKPEYRPSDTDTIEGKIDKLMKQQSEYKRIMDDHYKEYLQAKEIYESFSKKIDVLCSAMDIMNE